MNALSPPPPSAPAAATLPLSPSSSSSFNSSAPYSPLPHRPTVRVLSSQEDLASRPPSALSARSSPTPGPERGLSSRPAAQGPQTSTLNGRAVSPGTLFLASTRRVGSNGAEQSGGGLSTADAAGRIARESGSRDELERPSSTTSPTPQAQDVTPSAARPSGRTTPTPNALSPRLRPHGPIITRVSSPMDPSFAARTTPDTGSHDGSSSAAFPPSPTVAARPLSPPSTVARRSSSDLLAAYASPKGSHLAPLSPGDVVADSAAGASFVRERHATAGRASEDSFASGSMQDTLPPRPTVPASRPAQQAQSHTAEPPFSSLHVAPPRPSMSPPRPPPPLLPPLSRLVLATLIRPPPPPRAPRVRSASTSSTQAGTASFSRAGSSRAGTTLSLWSARSASRSRSRPCGGLSTGASFGASGAERARRACSCLRTSCSSCGAAWCAYLPFIVASSRLK